MYYKDKDSQGDYMEWAETQASDTDYQNINKDQKTYLEQIREFDINLSILKLFLGATAWQFTAFIMDGYIQEYNWWKYILRCLAVGSADGTFAVIGSILAIYIQKRLINQEKIYKCDFCELGKLWIAAFVVGAFWQMETDIAGWICQTQQGFSLLSQYKTDYRHLTMFVNFLMYIVIQTILFRICSILLDASWTELTVDIQVGMGGFGFYLSGHLLQSKSIYLNSMNAGLWTTLFSVLTGIPLRLMIKYKESKESKRLETVKSIFNEASTTVSFNSDGNSEDFSSDRGEHSTPGYQCKL